MNPLSLFNLPSHPLGNIIGLPQPWNFSVPDVTSNSRVGLSAITYCTKYCRYGGYTMEFALLSENGPSHNPLFVFCLKIVNPTALKLETVGQGHSKAAAKEDAARHMVTKLIAIFGELPPDMPNKSGEKTTNPRRKAKVRIEDTEWVKVTEAIPGSNAIGMMYGWANRKRRMAVSNLDTRLLSWGGFLSVNDLKSNKDNRWILTINVHKNEIVVVQHEQQHARYPFTAVLCCFANLKYDNA